MADGPVTAAAAARAVFQVGPRWPCLRAGSPPQRERVRWGDGRDPGLAAGS